MGLLFVWCIFSLIWGFSSAELTCYYCGLESHCVKEPSDEQIQEMDRVRCEGIYLDNCAKYTITFSNTDSYTYRDCAPDFLGGKASSTEEFCAFIKSLYQPVSGLLDTDIDCELCSTSDCNK